ncbi:hypothetical protein BJX64DRAFT_295324 [Aspergillus heterothallicus]
MSERPLRPAPSTSATPNTSVLRPRAQKVSTACTECRRRKAKLCVVDEESDRRRKGSLERRLESLERDRSLLLRLVESLSDDNDIGANEILSVIRSNASLDEIRDYLDPDGRPERDPRQEKFQELARALEIAVNVASSALPVPYPVTHQPSILPKPGLSRLVAVHGDSDRRHPYALAFDPIPAHTGCVSNHSSELQLILWELSYHFSGGYDSPTGGVAKGIYYRLRNWARGLPECIAETALVSPRSPATFDLHLRYHSAIVTIANVLDQADALVGRDAHRIGLSFVQTICSILRTFTSLWSDLYIPITFIRYVNLAISTLIADLDSAETRGLFVSTSTTLKGLSNRIPVAAEVLQRVQKRANQLQIHLSQKMATPNDLSTS